jgi:glycosyltransferase involved in cell wall biosynthesis
MRKLSSTAKARWRRERHDVVFYTPFIGNIFSSRSLSPPGGAETQILVLSKALAGRGLRVAIIAYGDQADLPEQVDGVRILARPRYRQGDKRIIHKALEALRIWTALWRAPSHTVVYRCASLELGLVALYTTFSRRRFLFSIANVVDFQFNQVARKDWHVLLYRLGVRLADAIVVQTEEQVPMCEATFRRRPHLIKSLSPPVGITGEEPEAFLWVGRLVRYKQPLAYVELARAVPEAHFRMVGVLPHDDREHSLAAEVATAAEEVPNLELLPPRSHAALGQLMAHAVASVNTGLWEGMPNVLLEAWCRGVPALVLEHDPGGVVNTYGLGGFAGGSRIRFAELARGQWSSRHDRSEVAQRCRAYVAAHHAPDAIATQWAGLLAGHPIGLESHTSSTMALARADRPTC